MNGRVETNGFGEIGFGEAGGKVDEAGGGQLAKHGRGPVPFRYMYRCVELFPTRLYLLTPNHCPLSCKNKAHYYA